MAEGGTLANPELSTVGDGLGVMAGTSVATAKVTAAVAQVWAANPQLNYRQVVEILQATATDVNALGWDQETGAGLLNVAAAVHLAKVTTGEFLVPRVSIVPVVPNYPVDDSAIPTERPARVPGTGTPVRVSVAPIPMSRPAVQALLPFTFAAAQSIISKGIKAITSPVGLLSIATAASVGMIVWAGTAYFDLKKAEAEAAANTAADVWCVTNPQECHAGDTTGHFRITAVTESGELFYH